MSKVSIRVRGVLFADDHRETATNINNTPVLDIRLRSVNRARIVGIGTFIPTYFNGKSTYLLLYGVYSHKFNSRRV